MNLNKSSVLGLALLLCTICQSEAISCYVCSSDKADGPCGYQFDPNDPSVTNQTDCKTCLKSTEEYLDENDNRVVSSYRGCSLKEAKYTNTGCCSFSRSSRCTYACTEEFCNTATSNLLSTSHLVLLAVLGVTLIGKNRVTGC